MARPGKKRKDGAQSHQGEGGGRPKVWTVEVIEKLGAELLAWMQKPDNFWLKTFAHEHGVHSQRLSEWAELSPRFADAYKIAKEIQEYKLLLMSLDRNRHPSGAIFALKNTAGWRNVVHLQHGGEVGVRPVEADPWARLTELCNEYGISLEKQRKKART